MTIIIRNRLIKYCVCLEMLLISDRVSMLKSPILTEYVYSILFWLTFLYSSFLILYFLEDVGLEKTEVCRRLGSVEDWGL